MAEEARLAYPEPEYAQPEGYHGMYKTKFEPVTQLFGYIAVIRSLDPKLWRFYQVIHIEPFFPRVTVSGVAQGSSLDRELSELKLPEGVIGHVRIVSMTAGYEIEVSNPPAAKMYMTADQPTRLTPEIVEKYPHMTEVFYVGDEVPRITVYNVSATEDLVIQYAGFKYVVREVRERPKKFVPIVIGTVVLTR